MVGKMIRQIRKRIFWKIYLLNGIVASLILTTAVCLMIGRFKKYLWEHVVQDLEEKAVLLGPLAEHAILSRDMDKFKHTILRVGQRSKTRITIIDKFGNVVADSLKSYSTENLSNRQSYWTKPEIIESLANNYGFAFRYSHHFGLKMMYVSKVIHDLDGNILGAVRVAISEEKLEGQVRDLLNWVVLFTLLGTLGILIGTYLVVRRITRPLIYTVEICKKLSRGEYHLPYFEKRSDEIGQLTTTLRYMGAVINSKIATITRERAQLESMMKAMTEGILSIGPMDTILFCNNAASDLLGIHKNIVNTSTHVLVQLYPWMNDLIHNARTSVSVVSKEIDIEFPKNCVESSVKTVSVHSSSFSLSNGRGVTIVIRDISQVRRLENMRRDFVANVSHEIKTPLTCIQGYVEVLQSSHSLDTQTSKRFLEKVVSNTERLKDLVRDILSLAKIESEKSHVNLEVLTWHRIISQVKSEYEQQARKHHIKLCFREIPDFSYVRGDVESMHLILDNLVSNALRYTPENGEICVSVSLEFGRVVLRVLDTGLGIPQADLSRVFERFYRVDQDRSRKLGGTGLGLAIVKNSVSALGGKIELESKLGKGSLFTVYLQHVKMPSVKVL